MRVKLDGYISGITVPKWVEDEYTAMAEEKGMPRAQLIRRVLTLFLSSKGRISTKKTALKGASK